MAIHLKFRWSDLVAATPLKICFPALEGREWQIITGSDPKNIPCSYHNGGSWPTLLWQLNVACNKMSRQEIAKNEIKRRTFGQNTRGARFIVLQALLFQAWSIAGYLVA